MSAPPQQSKHGREEYDDRDRPSKRATGDGGVAVAATKPPLATDMARMIASFVQPSDHRVLSAQDDTRAMQSELAALSMTSKAWQADLRRPLQTEMQINTASYLAQLQWIGKWTDRYKNVQMGTMNHLYRIPLIHDTVGAMGTQLVVPRTTPKSDLYNKREHYQARAAAWMAYTGATHEQLLAFRALVNSRDGVDRYGWWARIRVHHLPGVVLGENQAVSLSARSGTDGTPLDAILSMCGGEFTLYMQSLLEILLVSTAKIFGARIAQELLAWMAFMQQFDVFPELGESTSVDFPYVLPDVWRMTTAMRRIEEEASMQQ